MRANRVGPLLLWGTVLWLTALDLVFVAAGAVPFPYYSRDILPGGAAIGYLFATTILGVRLWIRISESRWGRRSVGPVSRWLLVLVVIAGTMPVCKMASWYVLSYTATGAGEAIRAVGYAAAAVAVTASKLWMWRQAYLLRGLEVSEIWTIGPQSVARWW